MRTSISSWAAAAWLPLLLAGCSLFVEGGDDDDDDDDVDEPMSMNETDYARTAAAQACSLYEECELLEYFGGTYDACLTQMEAAVLAYVQSAECDYDGQTAAACLEEWKDATCEGSTTGGTDSACDDVCGTGGTTGDSGAG